MDTAKINDPTLTVDEFCAAEKISRPQLYLDWKKGTGPDFFFNGKCRRISHEARTRWRRAREEAARASLQGATS
jgi:hypothetical protein